MCHFSPPVIALPKNGGAIRGLGEKFAANPVTGTGRHVDVCPVGARLGGARAGVPRASSARSLQNFLRPLHKFDRFFTTFIPGRAIFYGMQKDTTYVDLEQALHR
jgi:hypothetical protein